MSDTPTTPTTSTTPMTSTTPTTPASSLRLQGYKNRDNERQWAMLRPLAAQTLKVTRLLEASGLEVYCPHKVVMVRLPRSSKRTPRLYPIWPGLIFISSTDISYALATRDTLIDKELMPHFGLWIDENGIMTVWDCEIEGLRAEEAKEKERQRDREEGSSNHADTFDGLSVGLAVIFTEGPMEGKEAVIKRLDKVMAHVELEGPAGKPGRIVVPRFRLAISSTLG